MDDEHDSKIVLLLPIVTICPHDWWMSAQNHFLGIPCSLEFSDVSTVFGTWNIFA